MKWFKIFWLIDSRNLIVRLNFVHYKVQNSKAENVIRLNNLQFYVHNPYYYR
jgi:hypothetical protein